MDVLVFAGGDAVDGRWHAALPTDAFVIAADSGLEHAQALGRHADVVVGDMDSVAPEALEQARRAGSVIEQHPADKDATDLELALRAAQHRDATRVTIVGAGGGRLDHFLGNALLLVAPDWAGFELRAFIGDAHVLVVRGSAEVSGPVGSIISLLAVGGPARGVRTSGLRWPLLDEVLPVGSTRGLSNEMTSPTATVTLSDGVLLAIQPHAIEAANGDT